MSRELNNFDAGSIDGMSPGVEKHFAVFESERTEIASPTIDFEKERSDIEEVIIAALETSLRSASALSLLGRIEHLIADGSSSFDRPELEDLIEKWAEEIVGVDRFEIERLKRRLGNFRHLP